MATRSVRVLKPEWKLLSAVTAQVQVEEKGVEVYVTEALTKPTEVPDGNTGGSIAVRTIRGEEAFLFERVGGAKLWAYPKSNGGAVLVDDRSGAEMTERVRLGALSAFGELKVAEFNIVAAWLFSYNINSELIAQTVANGGTVTQSGAFAVLQSSTATDGSAKINTRTALKYETGVGGLLRFTATFTEGVPDSLQVVGLGDDHEGFFFGYNGATFGVFRRDGATDYFTAIDDWTEGTFAAFDPTKLNVYQIQFQWLGAGEIRFFIEDPDVGAPVLVHRIQYAGLNTGVTVTNPSFPIMAQVINDGNDSNLTITTPSASAGLEGNAGRPALRVTRAARGQRTDVDETQLWPLVSIRNPSTYKSVVNHLTLRFTLMSAGIEDSAARVCDIRLIRDGSLTGASFAFIDEEATPAQADVAASEVTGGTFLAGFVTARANAQAVPLLDLDINLRPGETMTLAAIGDNAVDLTIGMLTFISEV